MKIKYLLILSLSTLLMATCSSPAGVAPSGQVDSAQPLASSQAPPDAEPAQSPTADPAVDMVLRVAGAEEIVFDWTVDSCEPEHIPDLAARAIRDASGNVQLLISHYVNYRMLGPDLNNLTPDCSPVMRSDYQSDPGLYSDSEWIAAPYTEDGQTIYALVHNEYRGHTHSGVCPSGDYFDCLDTSITLAVSTDAGASYRDIAAPPDNLVATLPHQFEPGAGPFGYRTPSNIIKGRDGFYYSFNNVSAYQTQKQWVCLMRTDDLSDPQSWRFWDGAGFNGVFANPYREDITDIDRFTCQPLDREDIGASLNESITYNTYLDRYVLVGISADHLDEREVWGFYYAFSSDLLNWTKRKLLIEITLPWTVDFPGSDISHLYPALLDPSSGSLNFETTGKTAYLYFTRMNKGAGSLDRDLIRLPVEFDFQ